MSKYELSGNENGITINASNTVGFRPINYTTNETRTTVFTPRLLREWAELVEDVYGDAPAVEVVFTPDAPLTARPVCDEDYEDSVGVCVAPRIYDSGDGDE